MLGYYINLTPRRVFDLCPPLLKRRGGGNKERGANAPLKHPVNIGFQKEKEIKRKERPNALPRLPTVSEN
jgi:hypothetical protein